MRTPLMAIASGSRPTGRLTQKHAHFPHDIVADCDFTSSTIAPARGKLGVLLVGLGAVGTTTIAGVMAIRRGLALPIGSLTSDGHHPARQAHRGTGTEDQRVRSAGGALNDIVFGGWDIFEEDCYAAARTGRCAGAGAAGAGP